MAIQGAGTFGFGSAEAQGASHARAQIGIRMDAVINQPEKSR
jgi:hypothetical protein